MSGEGRLAEGGLLRLFRGLLPFVRHPRELSALEHGLGSGLERDAVTAGEGSLRYGAKGAARPISVRSVTDDPIDVVTGEVILRQVDVELAGVLPLVVERTHVSSYRSGGLFGASWASTLDQRLEVDSAGIWFAAPDGTILSYPVPSMPGSPVWAAGGPRWPLRLLAEGGYAIHDPQSGREWRFAAPDTDGVAWLSTTSVRTGDRIDFVRDKSGVVRELRHSGGYRVAVAAEAARVRELRLLDGSDDGVALVRYGYDPAGHLAEIIDSSGEPQRFSYDSDGRLRGWTDRNGFEYRYVYDGAGRAVRGEGTGGFLNASLSYDPAGRVTVVTDAMGRPRTYRFNERLQVVAETDPLGATVSSEWDRWDRPVARTDPLGRTSRWTYDEAGNLVAFERPGGGTISFTYNDAALPAGVVEEDGTRWEQEWNDAGNLVALVDPAGAVTRYHYDERGHVAAVTDPLGAVNRLVCDGAGLTTSVTDAAGGVTRYERDAFGRVITITDPAGGVTRMDWSVEGRLIRRVSPTGAADTWRHDAEGNLVSVTDPLGRVATMDYGPFDVPVAQVRADGTRLEFGYDAQLRLTSVTNPQGLVWRYTYDAAGRLAAETDFNGRTVRYGWDAAGQLVERVNGAGQRVSFGYDAAGNLTERSAGDHVVTFGYDAAGRMVAASDEESHLTWERDPPGRVVAEVRDGHRLSSVYDAAGRRTGRRTPSGVHAAWEHDPAGRPVALSAGGEVLRFGYDAAGREIERRIGVAAVLDQRWDPDSRLSVQSLRAPETGRQARLIQRRAYTYRADGNLAGVADQLAGDRRFDLDAAGRITAVHANGWTERYAYDTGGNLSHASWPTSGQADTVGDRDYTGTLIRRAGSTAFEHDAQGRVVTRRHRTLSGQTRTWRYTWDAEDRLIAVTTPDDAQWRYRYDPLGRRITKERLAPDGTTVAERIEFVWDGATLAEQTHSGGENQRTTTWDYKPGTFRPFTQTERTTAPDTPQDVIDEQFRAIITDLVGTPAEMVDATGTLTWRGTYAPWGANSADNTCPLRFPGQYHDPETGLNYNYQRYYDPTTARYQTSDPFGIAPHAYVSNPTTTTDPLGLAPYTVVSRIKEDARLVKEAERTGRSHQRSIDALTAQAQAGNLDAGTRGHQLFGHVFEMRAESGARVYYQKVGNTVEILAKSAKNNQDRVIGILQDNYARGLYD